MYIPLRNYTQFTISESILLTDKWIPLIKSFGLIAVGSCDKSNLFGLVQFYKQCLKNKIKPLIGIELLFQIHSHGSKKFPLILYAKNFAGYQALSLLTTDYYRTGQPLFLDALENFAHNIVMIIPPEHAEILSFWPDTWLNKKDLSLFMGIERYLNDPVSYQNSFSLLTLAKKYDIPPIVCNAVYFLHPEDYQIQQIKNCIQEGYYLQDENRPQPQKAYHHVYSPEQIAKLFEDIPIAIENTQLLAQKCTVELPIGQVLLPEFASNEKELLFQQAQEGLKNRLNSMIAQPENPQLYYDRLERELQMIAKMGFAGYFLIVSDFICWAKNNDIPVGPGRGSGAGSLAAFALNITDIDPLPYDLLFERFLNPERVSLPDFDVDFCMSRRDEVIHYVQKRYGSEYVSQIATFGTMAAKAVVRDVGRVLSLPFGFVDKVAKMIPLQVGITLSEALTTNPDFQELYNSDESVKELIDIALKLEGLPRNVGKHAGGVVISPKPLHEVCPLYNEPGASWHPITQLDKDDSESLGLIKFDFLGLKTLTVIHETYKNANRIQLQLPPVTGLNLADKASYDLMISGKTIGVFQVESRGFRDLITRVKPDCFEDIIALVALYRPGPLQSGMVDDFINRKHGLAPIVYPHPSVEDILKPTYGIILYQEQVMQIAQVLAGYSLGGADLLRRAMGKKKLEEMRQQREIFVQGAEKNGVGADISEGLFDLMEKFSGYGFNKSHAGAYAMIVYQTLYLKRHAPAPFFAATLSADADNLEKLAVFVEELLSLNLKLLPPCINRSDLPFLAIDNQTIQYGLSAIKGLGEQALNHILKDRKKNGPYSSFSHFIKRLSYTNLSKKNVEILIKVGAFDSMHSNRKALLHELPFLWDQFHQKGGCIGQVGLFDQDAQGSEELESLFKAKIEDQLWSERIMTEKHLLGFAISGTSFDPYKALTSLWSLKPQQEHRPTLAALIGFRKVLTQKGQVLVATQWETASGLKQEYYLNPQRTSEQELIEKIEKLSLDRPILLFCEKIAGTEQRKERFVLKRLLSIPLFIKMQNLSLVAHVINPECLLLAEWISSVQSMRLCCPFKIQYELKRKERSYGVQSFSFQNALTEEESTVMALIEKLYSFGNSIRLELIENKIIEHGGMIGASRHQ